MTTVPLVPLLSLDTLWIQVAGTLCNIACTHCFISCSPTNHTHGMMTLDQVERRIEEAAALGVREYYFTGGEPFMNREILPMIAAGLRRGPVSVLTNGMLLRRETCEGLRVLTERSEYSLDLRISLDGFTRDEHDAIRGRGSWDRAMEGLTNLAAAGLAPVITVSEVADGIATPEGRERFLEIIRSLGLTKPRLKVLPVFRIGAEERRSRGYAPSERLGAELAPLDAAALQCSSCRMVTSRGVYVCPILLDYEEARMGDALAETLRPFPLAYGACHTCWAEGATCRT